MTTIEQIMEAVEVLKAEDAKFEKGNASAGTRARKALQDIVVLAKQRRLEISAEKNERKAEKQ